MEGVKFDTTCKKCDRNVNNVTWYRVRFEICGTRHYGTGVPKEQPRRRNHYQYKEIPKATEEDIKDWTIVESIRGIMESEKAKLYFFTGPLALCSSETSAYYSGVSRTFSRQWRAFQSSCAKMMFVFSSPSPWELWSARHCLTKYARQKNKHALA